jgi:predicted metal-dependent phosphoesterase TrpH
MALPREDEQTVKLKADLHLHTQERESFIPYDAPTLIDRAAREGFRVLAITNHDTQTYTDALAAYARTRGVLLIPGVEATIEGRHVLIYNAHVEPARLRTFRDLRQLKRRDWLVVAPHPFFPRGYCLRNRLLDEIDLFDGVEFSHFYAPQVDFNRPAVRLAERAGLPLLGTSDSHLPCQLGTTYSILEVDSPTVAAVLAAIRLGRVSVVSRPFSLPEWTRLGARLFLAAQRQTLADAWRGRPARQPVDRPVAPAGAEAFAPAAPRGPAVPGRPAAAPRRECAPV